MDTYLLDTNLVSVLYDARRPNHQAVRQAVAALEPLAPQLISVITIGELRFGLALSRAAGQPLTHIEACIEKAEEHPLAEIGRYTGEAFAHVKSSVALQRLDIDENDLWLAAQAVERNFVVVTSDQDFTQIIAAAVPELRVSLI